MSAQQSFNPMRRRPETDLIRLFDASTPVEMNGGDMETETEEMEGDVELAIIDEEVGKKAVQVCSKRRAWVCGSQLN